MRRLLLWWWLRFAVASTVALVWCIQLLWSGMEWSAMSSASSFGLVPLPSIARLSPRVWSVLGLNPGPYTLQGTNTYLVGTGSCRLLIDTGAGVSGYLSNLLSCMADSGCSSLSAVLLTHWHHDHTGGLHDLLTHFAPHPIPVYKAQPHLRGLAPPSLSYQPLTPSARFRVEGASLSCVATPGHTSDHVSFLLEEEHSLFVGDCILGQGTSVFRHLYDYAQSLQLIAHLAPLRLYCGHGPVVEDAQGKVREYLQHRQRREAQLLAALQREGEACDAHQLVELVYPPLSAHVLPAAVQNVVLTLEKMGLEGRIARADHRQAQPPDTAEAGKDGEQSTTSPSSSPPSPTSTAVVDGAAVGDWSDKDYGEVSESTALMIQRKAQWTWKATHTTATTSAIR